MDSGESRNDGRGPATNHPFVLSSVEGRAAVRFLTGITTVN